MGRVKGMRETSRRALASAVAVLVVAFSGCVIEPLDPDEEAVEAAPSEPSPPEADEGGQDEPREPGEPTPLPWVIDPEAGSDEGSGTK